MRLTTSLVLGSVFSALAGAVPAGADDYPLFRVDIDEACLETVSENGIRSCRHAIVNEANYMRLAIGARMQETGIGQGYVAAFNDACPAGLQFIPLPHNQQNLQKDAGRVTVCSHAAEELTREFPEEIGISEERIIDFRLRVARNTGYAARP